MNFAFPECVDEKIREISLELIHASPGSEAGVLPIYNSLVAIRDQFETQPAPTPIRRAARAAVSWVESMLDSSLVFDPDTLSRIGDWIEWMNRARDSAANPAELPAWPDNWGAADDDGESTACAGIKNDESPNADAGEPVRPTSRTPAPIPGPASKAVKSVSEPVDDPELIREFVNESHEHLERIEENSLRLEQYPDDAEPLNALFRSYHSFKGGAGFLNLQSMQSLAHDLESLLDRARHGSAPVDRHLINLLLRSADLFGKMVAELEARLTGETIEGITETEIDSFSAEIRVLLDAEDGVDAGLNPVPQPPPPPSRSQPHALPAANPESGNDRPREEPGMKAGTSGALRAAADDGGAERRLALDPRGSVKVDIAKLDVLVDLVGELTMTQARLVKESLSGPGAADRLRPLFGQFERSIRELQSHTLALRMIPLAGVFRRMQRLARDTAVQTGKEIVFVDDGADTELDRSIAEAISDPLIHMIRNAVDHGIESGDRRVARGKPRAGVIRMSAKHQGGSIVISVSDDGSGLDRDRILRRARERGLVDGTAPISDREVFRFLFAPGFSTRDRVTDISGRGVGLDVVQRNIESIRGKIEIDSVPGTGTTFHLYCPLTLAVIDGLVVGVGDHRFIIPTLSVCESFRPKPSDIVQVRGGMEIIYLRNRPIPLLRLADYFGLPREARPDPTKGLVVLVESGRDRRCVWVDTLVAKREVVVKRLTGPVGRNRALAGGAVLEDGRVGLILDASVLVALDRDPALAAA